MNSAKQIEFYFDYVSPWAYFSWHHLKPILKECKASMNLHPTPYRQLAKLWGQRAIATIPPKRLFIFKFAKRYALKNRIPYKVPQRHPFKPYTCLRISLKEIVGDRQFEIVDLLFRACWVDQIDMGSDDELIRYLSQHGFDGQKLISKSQDAEIKSLLQEKTVQATDKGIFGVPTMTVDDELFWGVDQIEYLRDHLLGNDILEGAPVLSTKSWGLDGPMPEPAMITGVAHTALVVRNFEKCKAFYNEFLSFLGLRKVFESERFLYYIGGKTAIGIGVPEDLPEGGTDTAKFDQNRVGLHHLCLRARSRNHIDKIFSFLKETNAKIVHPPEEGDWAPGYYSILFEDPDGIRLEVNHVPGKGLFEKGRQFNPVGYE